MKKLLILILLVPSININASFLTGEILLNICDKNLSSYNSQMCAGYILGSFDKHLQSNEEAVDNNNLSVKYQNELRSELGKEPLRLIEYRECNIDNFKDYKNLETYVYKFLSNNPQGLDMSAGFLLTVVYNYAFNCGIEAIEGMYKSSFLKINYPSEKLGGNK